MSPFDEQGSRPVSHPIAAAICVILLVVFAALSWSAARTKCPTYDEPLNTVGAWMITHEGEWRIHPDHPPLWQYWAALPNGPSALQPDRSQPVWDQMLQNYWLHYLWSADMLFKRPGVDAETVVHRSRAMLLILAVALGALIARWAWVLGGPIAAIVALSLFAFDPNLLGHASLVKNDLALALSALALTYALWRLGQRATLFRAAVAAVAFAAGFGIKFSALAFLPLTALALAARALLPEPWPVFGRSLSGRGARLVAGALLFTLFVGTAWGGIWACYRFRYSPSADPAARLDTGHLLERMRRNEIQVSRSEPGAASPAQGPQAVAWTPGPLLRSVLWAERNQVLPQAWLYGLVYSQEGLQRREGFLLGEHRLTGWWYYMPAAILFKTPLATLIVVAWAAVAGFVALRGSWRSWRPAHEIWSALCLCLPFALFWTALIASHVSMGVRHAFTVYPYVFIAVGLIAASTRPRWSRGGLAVAATLLSGLLLETLSARPDYIAFFNAAFRPLRLDLIGDSNLDWGQDLKLLREWQRRHPGRTLYLAYFGQADPVYYGIISKRLPTTSLREAGTELPVAGEPAVIAVSATHLQQIYIHEPRLAAYYERFRRRPPLAILGGTIYLFEADLSERQSVAGRADPNRG